MSVAIKTPYVPKKDELMILNLLNKKDKGEKIIKVKREGDFRGYKVYNFIDIKNKEESDILKKLDKVDTKCFHNMIEHNVLIYEKELGVYRLNDYLGVYLKALNNHLQGKDSEVSINLENLGNETITIIGNYKEIIKNKDYKLNKTNRKMDNFDKQILLRNYLHIVTIKGYWWADVIKFDNSYCRIDLKRNKIDFLEISEGNKVTKLKRENTDKNPKLYEIDKYYFNNIDTFEKLYDSISDEMTGEISFTDGDGYYVENYYLSEKKGKTLKLTIEVIETDWNGEKTEYIETNTVTIEEFLEFLRKRKFGNINSRERFSDSFKNFLHSVCN